MCLDGSLNVVLEKSQEIKDARILNEYQDIFLRGNNVLYIRPASIIS